MDNCLNWDDDSILINELIQGKENAYKLKFHLLSTSPNEAHDLLLQRIVSSYDKALAMVLGRGYGSGRIQTGSTRPSSATAANGSSITLDEEFDYDASNFKDSQEDSSTSKKRKLTPAWTQRVKVGDGAAGPADDGCSWRKYGQKDILGAKYPRSYYRCTYKFLRNCPASKQVQRSDEDPAVFEVTYKGTHACGQSNYYASAPRQPSGNSYVDQTQEEQKQTVVDMKSNLRVGMEDSDKKLESNDIVTPPLPAEHCYFSIFASSATSESDYYYNPTAHIGFDFCHSGISDVSEMASSAQASTNNSPIGGMGFDQDFLFDNMGFFS